MAKTTITLTADQMTLAGRIRALVSGALSQSANDMADASDALKNASEITKNSGRLGLAREIANLSHDEQWKGNDIAAACEYARTIGNGNEKTAKTLNTAISEMRLFANPNVRADVGTLADACQQAWDEETMEIACADPEDRKSVPTPIRNYAPRVYHLLCSVTRAVKDNKLDVYNSADVVWWAKVNDPAFNPANTLKKVQTIMKQLDTIREIYKTCNLDAASDVLREIDQKMLEAGLTKPVHVKPGYAPPAYVPAPVPVVTPEVNHPVILPVAPVPPVTAATLLADDEPSASASASAGAPADGAYDYGHDDFAELTVA
jgi:hypothetical protein